MRDVVEALQADGGWRSCSSSPERSLRPSATAQDGPPPSSWDLLRAPEQDPGRIPAPAGPDGAAPTPSCPPGSSFTRVENCRVFLPSRSYLKGALARSPPSSAMQMDDLNNPPGRLGPFPLLEPGGHGFSAGGAACSLQAERDHKVKLHLRAEGQSVQQVQVQARFLPTGSGFLQRLNPAVPPENSGGSREAFPRFWFLCHADNT